MKTEHQKLIKSLGIKIPSELDAYISSGIDDVSDYCHEVADSSEDVIYYGYAKDLYHSASDKEQMEAEYAVEDCGGFPENIDMSKRYTILAYWIIYNRLEKTIRREAENVEILLREKIEELEQIANELQKIAN